MREIRNIVVLTSAGISAESGLQTFRAVDGLWEGHRVERSWQALTVGGILS